MKTSIAIGLFAAAFNSAGGLLGQAVAPADWTGIIEKGGTVAVLVWMVFWFQRRSDADKERIEGLADRMITSLDKSADAIADSAKSNTEMAKSNLELAKAFENFRELFKSKMP